MSKDACFGTKHLPRVFLSLIFVVGGFNFLTNFSGTAKFVESGLTPWGLAGIATLATVVAIVLKLGGGLMLLLNFRPSQAAWMLIVFTVLATLMYHMNWNGDNAQMQITSFLKNIAIIGGLMLFAKCPCPRCKDCCNEDNGGECCKSSVPPTA
ncbi:MAG: DoxX family protein [Candidatus Moranbacteria bacterium]|nr:DoxX family protein [Candidatus Moranbacteria bacterium]